MRIYAVADIHSQPGRIERIRGNIQNQHPDLLVLAGDLTRFFRPQATLEQLNSFGIPTLLVRGNTDSKRVEALLDRFPNLSSPGSQGMIWDDYTFVGLNGTIPIPFRSQISLTERWSQTIPLLDEKTILIAHPPPWGVLDSVFFGLHAGCPKLRDVILKQPPLLLICGHIHESYGQRYLGQTLVVNCSIGREGAGFLIELDQQKIRRVDQL